jgi:hypothetical protein
MEKRHKAARPPPRFRGLGFTRTPVNVLLYQDCRGRWLTYFQYGVDDCTTSLSHLPLREVEDRLIPPIAETLPSPY